METNETVTNPRTWTDQPKALEGASILCSFKVDRPGGEYKIVEIRKLDGGVYALTCGNLFGSETIECPSADLCFLAIEQIGKRAPKLPAGCKVLRSETKPIHVDDL
jgi:hypothetical protein